MPPVSVGSAKSTSGVVVVEGRAEKNRTHHLLLLLARGRTNAQIQGFSRHRTNPQRAPPAHSRNSYGGGPGGRTAEEGREEKDAKKHLPLSLSLSPLLEYHVLNDTRSTRARPHRDQSSLTR